MWLFLDQSEIIKFPAVVFFVMVLRNFGPCHGQRGVSVTKLIQINLEATVCRRQIILRRAARAYGETAGSTSPFCCAIVLFCNK